MEAAELVETTNGADSFWARPDLCLPSASELFGQHFGFCAVLSLNLD